MPTAQIIEKKLNIPPDYQYQAINSHFWLQKNWHKNKYLVINNLLKPQKHHNVLDLGTGSGNFELLFARKVKSITGVDYNDSALNFLSHKLKKNKIKNVKLLQADIRKLPKSITKQKYHFIILIDVIEHIEIDQAQKLLANLKLLLKKNGRLLIITPNYYSPWIIIEPVLDIFTAIPKLRGQQHLAKFTSKNLSAILKKHNYKSIQFFSFNLFSFIFPNFLDLQLIKLEIRFLRRFNYGCLLVVQATV